MVHVLAALTFTLVAIAAVGFILITLMEARGAIVAALGFSHVHPVQAHQRLACVRVSVRPMAVRTRMLERQRAAA